MLAVRTLGRATAALSPLGRGVSVSCQCISHTGLSQLSGCHQVSFFRFLALGIVLEGPQRRSLAAGAFVGGAGVGATGVGGAGVGDSDNLATTPAR